ncbi:MAG TPA: gephyrin-like molybdotransferase Glp [Solirubrobacteraceae bacterium]|nr:gephyrin-like molybdotransferase Glp [Solirubrobacteraceae bacterium]
MSLITIAEARQLVLDSVRPLPAETVPLAAAVDRVLAEDIRAGSDVPPFACSAMDGYAIHAGPAGRRLRLVGESRAGAPADTPALAAGDAIRVSTGAAIPAGATAVIPQERTELDGDTVVTLVDSAEREHVRGAGEDMRSGAVVLDAGTTLGPLELGAAIAAGAATLTVARRPRVAVLSTGDELREPGEPLGPGEIHNSNATMLCGLAERCGAAPTAPERIPDDRDHTIATIGAALDDAEVVVLSGGVSVGPHDHVKPALAVLGVEQRFWRVALQPGKPTWFGAAGDRLVFGLPGNPVSAVVTFSLFVAPALAALQCGHAPRPPHGHARLGVAVRRNPERVQAVRVTVRAAPNGALVARPTGAQGSHILSSLLGADALAMIPEGEGALAPGAVVALEALVR